jgi:hypothetical protein
MVYPCWFHWRPGKGWALLWLILGGALPAAAQFNKYEKADSLFSRSVSPVLDRRTYERLAHDDAILYFACFLKTDTSGKIFARELQPLFNIGNHYKPVDSIWTVVSMALGQAMDRWIFRSIMWDVNKYGSSEMKINKQPYQRPFGGMPKYLIIYEISSTGGVSIDKVSYITTYKVDAPGKGIPPAGQ